MTSARYEYQVTWKTVLPERLEVARSSCCLVYEEQDIAQTTVPSIGCLNSWPTGPSPQESILSTGWMAVLSFFSMSDLTVVSKN